MKADVLSLEPLRADWIPRALLLSDEAGWNQTAADWAVFVTHGTVLGLSVGDRLVGTAAVLPYGDGFGWVSMVLVTAEYRHKGLAHRLVRACVSILEGQGRAALLDAAPEAAGIYAGFGFVALCQVERWAGEGGGGGAGASGAADFALDETAFGADRRFLLEDFLSRPGSVAFRTRQGFAILRRGSAASQLGPIVGRVDEAGLLIAEAIGAASGRIVVDVLDAGREIIQTLIAHGFERQRGFTRMALGLAALPGNPAQLLAAAGPEFG